MPGLHRSRVPARAERPSIEPSWPAHARGGRARSSGRGSSATTTTGRRVGPDRRGRGLHRAGRPRLACPVRRDGPQPGHVRAAGPCLRVPCLRDVRLPQRGDRNRPARRPPCSSAPSSRSTGVEAMRLDRIVRATTRRRGLTAERAAADAARIARLPRRATRQRARARGGGVRARHRLDRARPVRPGVAAATRGRAGRRAGARSSRPRRGSASPTPASRGRRMPWRFVERGHRSVSGPTARRADRRAVDGPALARACSSSRPSAPGWRRPPRSRRRAGWPRRSSRRDDPVIVARGARRDRPGAGAHRGAAGRRDRRGPRHRPGDRTGRARRPAGAGPVPRDRRRRSMRPRGWRRRSPTSAGRCCASSAASSTPCRRCARRWRAASTRSASCSTRRRRGSVACARPSGSPTTGCGGGSTRSSAPSSAAPSRSRSSRSATGATSCRSRPRRGRGSRASSTTRRAAARPCSSSRSWRSSSGNAWREAQVAEAEEIARILDELSALVAANAAALRETLDALARFDLWAAKASLAGRDGRDPGRDRRSARGRPAVGPPSRA